MPRQTITVDRSSAGSAPPPADERRAEKRRVGWLGGLGLVGVLVAATILVVQLRHTDVLGTIKHVRLDQLGLAVVVMALSLVAAAYNLSSFSPRRLRLVPTVLAQLAVSGFRMIAPSAVSTPAVATRFLVCSGASTPEALATVGVAQSTQLAVTTVVVAGIGLASGRGLSADPRALAIAGGVVVLIAALIVLAARLSARVGAILSQARTGVSTLAIHARRRPGLMAVGVLASAALTATHILAFAFCVSAAGGHLSLLALTTIYLAAATAGSIIPTPGGVGPVEAALIAGLSTAGLPLPIATTAALLSRLVSVWLLALPGWCALVALRRRGLL